MADDDIAAMFSAVTRDLEPEIAAMVAAGTARGRRRRSRRRLTAILSAGLAMTAIAIGGVAAHGALAGAARLVTPVAGLSPTPSPTPAQHHSPTPPAVPQEHGPGLTHSQMLAILEPMLPAGWTVSWVDPLTDPERGTLDVNIVSGSDAADIYLSTWATDPAVRSDQLDCPNPPWTNEGPRPAGAVPMSCVRRELPGGYVERDAVTYADAVGYYGYQIYLDRPDGVMVSIQVSNGTEQGVPHPGNDGWPILYSSRPPGTLAFWEPVVESSKWHL